MILQLQHRHINLLKQETKRVHPIEACAILFGKILQNKAVVETIEIAQNRLRSTTRFEVDPQKVATAVAEAENMGLEFIGLFHSHPANAMPSSIDRKFMKLWGDALWLIISSIDNTLAAYHLVDGELEQVTIKIE